MTLRNAVRQMLDRVERGHAEALVCILKGFYCRVSGLNDPQTDRDQNLPIHIQETLDKIRGMASRGIFDISSGKERLRIDTKQRTARSEDIEWQGLIRIPHIFHPADNIFEQPPNISKR
jgi:hypothetical protein